MAYNKYQKGKIYLIRSPSRPDIDPYYGSTISTLQQRFNNHKVTAKKHNHSSKILIDCGDAIMELVEDYPCQSKLQLLQRERLYIENNKCINKVIPIRMQQELYELHKKYYEQNKKYIMERKQKHYQINKEKTLLQRKKKHICICGSEVRHSDKARHERSKGHINYISTIDI